MYQMVYGRTPFAELPFLQKMHAICEPKYQVGRAAGPGCSRPHHARRRRPPSRRKGAVAKGPNITLRRTDPRLHPFPLPSHPAPPTHQVKYPGSPNPDAVDVIQRCLDRDPKTRISMQVGISMQERVRPCS
jgi:serine/threonine protein kinase